MNEHQPHWTLCASAFNWTPEAIRAERTTHDIAVDIVRSGIARVIEIEAGQTFRSFPVVSDAEVDALRAGLDAVGGKVGIVGASLDEWAPDRRRRSEDERFDFLLPQLRAAHRLGAAGVRLPIGAAGPVLLSRLVPVLHELDLTLFEEVQGGQVPSSPAVAGAYEQIAIMDDPRVRLLVDISMLMPALPPSYLERLEAQGVPRSLIVRLHSEWRDPDTATAVLDLLRSGGVPLSALTLYMDLLVRFGRAEVAELRGVLPLVAGVHLKFWDLDDGDDRISAPIRAIATELARIGYQGTLCSEWGGHAWIDDLAADEATTRHLTLAVAALSQGAR